MKAINSTNNLLTLKNYKNFKTIYQYNILKKVILNKNFFIFYYGFLSNQDKLNLQLFLKKYDLNLIKIKKNINKSLLNKNYPTLKNILSNNTFIIYTNNNDNLDYSNIYKETLKIKNINLIGAFLNKKLYRSSEFIKLSTLSNDIKKLPIFLLKKNINKLKNYLSLKKFTN